MTYDGMNDGKDMYNAVGSPRSVAAGVLVVNDVAVKL